MIFSPTYTNTHAQHNISLPLHFCLTACATSTYSNDISKSCALCVCVCVWIVDLTRYPRAAYQRLNREKERKKETNRIANFWFWWAKEMCDNSKEQTKWISNQFFIFRNFLRKLKRLCAQYNASCGRRKAAIFFSFLFLIENFICCACVHVTHQLECSTTIRLTICELRTRHVLFSIIYQCRWVLGAVKMVNKKFTSFVCLVLFGFSSDMIGIFIDSTNGI